MDAIHNVLSRVYNFYQDGTTCKNPTLEAKTLEGLEVGCVKSDGTIVMTIDPSKTIHCVEIYVTCGDCPTCPKHRIVECFCGSGLACPPCHTCDPVNNRCIPICPDKLCVNNTCADCDPNHPCPPGKVCNNGKCECAPGTVPDGFGNCTKCLNNTDCSNCGLCQGFDCIPKQCNGGFLDPINCICVECLEQSHCRPDQICDHGFCKCAPGYYLNPATGLCTILPKCTTGTHCPECFDCVLGNCTPKACPVGTKCVRNECVSECPCGSNLCPPGKTCVPIGGKCYCVSCANIPCSPGMPCPIGCMCGGNGSCQGNPCNGPCDENNPCAPGCGCNLTLKKCQPCGTFNCSECGKVPGCHCPNGLCISTNPCPPTPCTSGVECGPGCGCDKVTGTCRPCNGKTCTNCLELDGCICNPANNSCGKNDCDGDCIPGVPCKPGCACDPITYKCRPCSSFNCATGPCPEGCDCVQGGCRNKDIPRDVDPNCADSACFVAEDDFCALRLNATIANPCPCPDIDLVFEGQSVTDSTTGRTLQYTLSLRKGGVLLGSTGISNEKPTSGSVLLTLTYTYEALNAQGVRTGVFLTKTETVSVDYANLDSVTKSLVILGNYSTGGGVYAEGGVNYEFYSLRVKAKSTATLEFASDCDKDLPETDLAYTTNAATSALIVLIKQKPLRSLRATRGPIATIYKGSNVSDLSNPVNIMKRLYLTPLGANNYTYQLTQSHGVEACKLYAADIECSCKPGHKVFYNCTGCNKSTPTPLTFKLPKSIKVSFDSMGKKVIFDENVGIDCAIYVLAAVRPTYQLLINGVVVDTKQLPANGILYTALTEFTVADAIWEVRLRQTCDVCNKDLVYDTNELVGTTQMLLIPPPCYDASNDLTVRLTLEGVEAPATYEIKKDAGTVDGPSPMTHTSKDVVIPNAAGLYEVFVTDASGNILRREINYIPENTSIADNVVITGTCSNGIIQVKIENKLKTETITLVDWPGTGGDFNVNPESTVFKTLPSGNYPTLKVQSANFPTCEVIKSLNLDCCTPLPADITAFAVDYSCANGLEISDTPGITVKIGSTTLIKGQSLTAGNHNIDVTNGICTQARVLVVQPCYQCLLGNCSSVGATVNNKGFESALLCQPTCDPCQNNTLSTPTVNMANYCTTKKVKVTVTGGGTPYIFKIDGIVVTANLVAGVYELDAILEDGAHAVDVIDNNGCTKSAQFAVSCCSGLNIGVNDITARYVCHPASPYVEILLTGNMVGGSRVKITGAGGFEDLWSTPSATTEIMTLSPGVYTAYVQHSNGCMFTKQFTVVGCWNCDILTHSCNQIISGQNVGYGTQLDCLTNCSSGSYAASYNCSTGLTVNTSHFIKRGNAVWGPFANTDHAFLTDNDYQIYANAGGQLGELIGTVTVVCCAASTLSVSQANCNGSCPAGFRARFSLQLAGGNPGDTYQYEVLDTNNDLLAFGSITAGGAAVVTDCFQENIATRVVVTNVTYMNRTYTDTPTPTRCGPEKQATSGSCGGVGSCDLSTGTIMASAYLAMDCNGGNASKWKLNVSNVSSSPVNISLYLAEVNPGDVCGNHGGYPGSPTHVFNNVSAGATICQSFTNPPALKEHCVKIVIAKASDPTCTITLYRGTEQ